MGGEAARLTYIDTGAMIPCSYGFFKIRVSNRGEDRSKDLEELVIVHIMEHINAVMASELEFKKILSDTSVALLLECLRKMHNHGMVHEDLSPDNILIQHPLNYPRIVFIDFGMATTYKEKERREKEFKEGRLRDKD
ncbi:hypothetical protein V5O48_019005, partial [Marasmius crinis-equi]